MTESYLCLSCADPIADFMCEECYMKMAHRIPELRDSSAPMSPPTRRTQYQFPRIAHCGTCHREKFHGVIPNVVGRGTPVGPHNAVHRSESEEGEMSPWHENAVGCMEDGA